MPETASKNESGVLCFFPFVISNAFNTLAIRREWERRWALVDFKKGLKFPHGLYFPFTLTLKESKFKRGETGAKRVEVSIFAEGGQVTEAAEIDELQKIKVTLEREKVLEISGKVAPELKVKTKDGTDLSASLGEIGAKFGSTTTATKEFPSEYWTIKRTKSGGRVVWRFRLPQSAEKGSELLQRDVEMGVILEWPQEAKRIGRIEIEIRDAAYINRAGKKTSNAFAILYGWKHNKVFDETIHFWLEDDFILEV